MQVRSEDSRVFEDGTILDDGFFATRNGHYILESLVEKVDLQIERPALHIFIEVFEIGVEVYRFEEGRPSVVLGKHFGECGFPAADVSGDGDVHGCRVIWRCGYTFSKSPKSLASIRSTMSEKSLGL